MKRRLSAAMVASALAMMAGAASAADTGNFTYSGFGTLAMTSTDSNEAGFARFNQGSGAKKAWEAGVDSNFGVQGNYKVNDALSFTGQVLARKFADNDYGAELTWAFAKYKINDHLNVRVGRIGTPVYMVSDFLDVGYANTMIRPSPEVYRQVPNSSFNGLDFIYQNSFGDTNLTAQFGGGNVKVYTGEREHYTFRPVKFVNLVAEHGAYTARFGYAVAPVSAKNSTSAETLLGTLKQVGLGSVAAQLSITDVDASFSSFGLTADYGSWFVQSELAKRRSDSRLIMNTTSWYGLVGIRFGKFTPYYHHGNVQQDSIRTMPGLPTSGPLAGLTAAVNGAIRTGLQSTDSIGIRWDFHKAAAFKAQIDHIRPRGGNGGLQEVTPKFSGSALVYALGVDYVF